MNRIKLAWKALRYNHATSNVETEYALKSRILLSAAKLLYIEKIPLERYQMIASALLDRSVILQSMHKTNDKYVPTVIYDCESEEDFIDLTNQIID